MPRLFGTRNVRYTNVRDAITIEQLKKHLPAVIEVGGATKLSATAKKKIEELAVGDEVEFVEAGVPEYGDMRYYTTVMLYLKIGGRKCAAYLQPGQFRGTNPTLEDLADNRETMRRGNDGQFPY